MLAESGGEWRVDLYDVGEHERIYGTECEFNSFLFS